MKFYFQLLAKHKPLYLTPGEKAATELRAALKKEQRRVGFAGLLKMSAILQGLLVIAAGVLSCYNTMSIAIPLLILALTVSMRLDRQVIAFAGGLMSVGGVFHPYRK